MLYHIEIILKKGFRDCHADNIKHDITYLGIGRVPEVSYFPVYSLEGELNLRELNNIAKNLLVDPVTQTCTIVSITPEVDQESSKVKASSTSRHEIEVWFKPGVTDTVAESVVKAVKDLGINRQVKVKTGHKYRIKGCFAHTVEHIADRLLVNPLIQQYTII